MTDIEVCQLCNNVLDLKKYKTEQITKANENPAVEFLQISNLLIKKAKLFKEAHLSDK